MVLPLLPLLFGFLCLSIASKWFSPFIDWVCAFVVLPSFHPWWLMTSLWSRMHGWSVEDSSLAHILSVITTLFYVSITCCTENLFNLSKQGNMSLFIYLFIFILSFSQGQRHLMAKVVPGPTWPKKKKKNYT